MRCPRTIVFLDKGYIADAERGCTEVNTTKTSRGRLTILWFENVSSRLGWREIRGTMVMRQ